MLDKGGAGAVALTAPDGITTLDFLASYPELDTDLARGRDLDGNWTYLEPARLVGAVNVATTYAGWLRPVTFSEERGFHQNLFTLAITNNNPEATVYYSLDGSVPTIPYTAGNPDRGHEGGARAGAASGLSAASNPERDLHLR